LVYRQSLGMAVSVGLVSPLIALGPMAPFLVFFALFDVRYWLVFLTGVLTGVLVRACLSIGQESGRSKAKHAAGP
jgi:hypothetical protein